MFPLNYENFSFFLVMQITVCFRFGNIMGTFRMSSQSSEMSNVSNILKTLDGFPNETFQ